MKKAFIMKMRLFLCILVIAIITKSVKAVEIINKAPKKVIITVGYKPITIEPGKQAHVGYPDMVYNARLSYSNYIDCNLVISKFISQTMLDPKKGFIEKEFVIKQPISIFEDYDQLILMDANGIILNAFPNKKLCRKIR